MSSGFAQQVESDRESAPAASQGANYFTLEVCNSNRRKIFIALSSKDAPGARDWYVAGWWNVEPGECRNLGRYPRPSIYLHAEDSGGGRWNGPDVRICVEKQKFKRVNYGNHKCSGPQLRGFYKKTITSDKFTWRLTPG
ncbi:MAG TPA: DUF1036 domain-containing protein [Pseudolabrys sp.]|nr:DUF1036 domain-containing protein [Pseudolabrys sp.]